MNFKEIKAEDLNFNPFKLIGSDWMLISAGDSQKFNTMTASWGGVGVLWGRNVVTTYIRPQRYTKEFVDNQELFSLSFFDGYKKELGLLGSVSGRDEDKIKKSGLTPIFIDGVPAFDEAKIIIIAKNLYKESIKPECFFDNEPDEKWYPEKDYHDMYIAEIQKVYVK